MVSEQILSDLEDLLRENWGYKFNAWVKKDAEKAFIDIYKRAIPNDVNCIVFAKNLYYAMESYVYFADNNMIMKDLSVFLGRIIEKQTNNS